MTNGNLMVSLAAFGLALLLAGCATEPVTGPRSEQLVMDAQHTAKSKTPPMQAVEADAIYKNYIENIGKPVRPTSAMQNDNP